MRPRTKVAFLILMTIGGILPLSVFLNTPAAHGMVRFGSYAELEHFLLTRTSCGTARYNGHIQMYGQTGRPSPAPLPAALGAQFGAQGTSTVSPTPSHSDTNNQVAGVDELDTVKTDGQYIYTVSNNTVVIVDAYPVANAGVVSRIPLENQTIDGIFVDGDKLSLVSEAPKSYYYPYAACGIATGFPGVLQATLYYPLKPKIQNASITVYDISNHSSPTLQTTLSVNGAFVGARLIGDFVYLVTSSPARFNQTLPVTIVNGNAIQTQASEIYHSDVSDAAFSYTTVVALDMNHDNPLPTVETYLLGTSSTIYVSLTNIFLTQPVWIDGSGTIVHRINISGSSINYEATGTVPGHVLNQFSMDEYNGYFRIATSGYGFATPQETNLYVLDSSLHTTGTLEGLSPGEAFYAARFMGDRAYLVTYQRMDPLFVVGLQDPHQPKVLGQLNVTGVSDYLQPYDESHLIGIGKSSTNVTWENAALFQGLKFSLFDVSDPSHPIDTSDFQVGDRGSDSPALTDHRAVLFDQSRNLLVVPIEIARSDQSSDSTWAYGSNVWQGAYIFNVSVQNGLVFRGGITHLSDGEPPGYTNSPLFITRALYIGNVLYTLSEGMIKMNSLVDLSELGSIILV